jgi:hypothetical protein
MMSDDLMIMSSLVQLFSVTAYCESMKEIKKQFFFLTWGDVDNIILISGFRMIVISIVTC